MSQTVAMANDRDLPPAVVGGQCSARGCRQSALWLLVWNNPKLHTAGREKRWAACDEHRPTLGAFLDARGFLRRVEPVPAVAADE